MDIYLNNEYFFNVNQKYSNKMKNTTQFFYIIVKINKTYSLFLTIN